MTEDAVSWLVIEPGWAVEAADGTEIGTIAEVVGDRAADIFDGLAIKPGMLSGSRYVPAERVGTIEPGRVHVTLSPSEVDGLGEYREPPPSEQILPERASLMERFRGLFGR